MSKKLSLSDVNEKLKQKHIHLTDYISSHIKVDAVCEKCGNIWNVAPYSLINNTTGCPQCNKKKASLKLELGESVFWSRCDVAKNKNIELLEYINTHSLATFKCNVCNNVWKSRPYSFEKHQSCPKCQKCQKLTHGEFLDRIYKTHNKEYDILSKYDGANKKISVRHIVCGTVFDVKASNFIDVGCKKGSGCPVCNKYSTKSIDYFKNALYKKYGNAFILSGEYSGITNDVILEHRCGEKFSIRANKAISTDYKCLCPNCDKEIIKMSKGEKKIYQYLYDNGYSFKYQYRIKECRNNKPLPFDFAVFIKNQTILLEYDGWQHFEYREDGIFSEENFNKIKYNDSLKDDFCKKNGICLKRIPYSDYDNINDILDEFFQTAQRLSKE